MDFRPEEIAEQMRSEVRAFVEEHVTREVLEREHRAGDCHDWDVYRALAERGWISGPWPVESGGEGWSPFQSAALDEELGRVSCPRVGIGTTSFVGQVLQIVGNDFQRREILPRIVSGEVVVSLGYTEPQAGSDVAAAATRAVRAGDDWVIDGQKMFTTLGHLSQYTFLLTRTDPDAAKHRGLTMFLLPLDLPGIDIQRVDTLGGERTNLIYYSGVRVADRYRVGDVNGGMTVLALALEIDQGASFYVELDRIYEAALEWARTPDEQGARPVDDPVVRERLTRSAIDAEVARLLFQRVAWMRAVGTRGDAEGPMAKLFSSEALIAGASDLLDLLGAEGLLQHGEADAPAEGLIELSHRAAQGTTIYAGTSEVMRSRIAETRLGLPRSRAR